MFYLLSVRSLVLVRSSTVMSSVGFLMMKVNSLQVAHLPAMMGIYPKQTTGNIKHITS